MDKVCVLEKVPSRFNVTTSSTDHARVRALSCKRTELIRLFVVALVGFRWICTSRGSRLLTRCVNEVHRWRVLVSILAPGTRCTGEGPIHAHAIHTGHHTTCCIDIWNGNTTIDEVHIDNVRTKKIHIVCRIQSDDAVPDVDPGTTSKVDLMAIESLMKR